MAQEWRNSRTWRSVITWRGTGAAAAITDLAASPTSVTIDIDETTETVTLSWTKPAGISTQTIWQSFNDGPFMDLATINDVPDEWDVDVGIGEYQWYITTTGTGGTSAPSNIVTLIAVAGSTAAAQPAVRATTRVTVSIIGAAGTIDATATATMLQWGDNAHGSHQAVIALTGQDSRDFVRMLHQGAITVRIRNSADIIWYGTVEDWVISGMSLQIAAYGQWSGISAVPYTEFWSVNELNAWKAQNISTRAWVNEHPSGLPGLAGEYDTTVDETAIRIAPRNGVMYHPSVRFGVVSFRIPEPTAGVSRRTIKQLQLGYHLNRFTPGHVLALEVWTFSTQTAAPVFRFRVDNEPSTVTSSTTITFAESDVREIVLAVWMLNDDDYPSGAPFDGTPLTDYVEITSARVMSTTAATVTPTAIITDILDHINLHNPGLLNTSTSQIASVTMDLPNINYQDTDPADILRQLASLGVPGGSTPLDVGVGTSGLLYYRLPLAAGTADSANGRIVREVYLPNSPDEARYSLNALVNAAYGTYDTPYGTARTTPTVDTNSIARFGRKRMKPIEALTGSAQLQPQQLLVSDNATPRPAVEVSVSNLFDSHGNVVPLSDVRRGDWLVIESTQLGLLSDQVLDLRIRILETRYDGTADTLTLTLENSPPRLDVILGQLMLDQ